MHTYYKYRCHLTVKSAGFVGRMRYKDNFVKRKRKHLYQTLQSLKWAIDYFIEQDIG